MGLLDKIFDFGKKKKIQDELDENVDEEYLRRHRKLEGIILVYGEEGSGKTEFIKTQLSLDVFRTYYVIVIGDKERYSGISGIDVIFSPNEITSFSDLKNKIKNKLKEDKIKSAVIVFDDADDLAERFGSRFWRYVNTLSRKHQIILASRKPPDNIRQPQMIVRMSEPGGDVVVFIYREGGRISRNKYSWAQVQSNAIFMEALLE